MKPRALLSTILILCSTVLFAQTLPEENFRQAYFQWIKQFNKQAESYKKAGIQTVSKTSSKLDEDSVLVRSKMSSRIELDTLGRIMLYQDFWRRGRIANELRTSYDNQNRIKTIQFGTGKRKTVYTYEYYNDSLIAAIKGQTKRDAFIYKYTYNSKLELTELAFHKNAKQVKRIEYSYYENGSKKETKVFDKRNKLKQTYSYACGIEESVKNKKDDTSYVCSNTTDLPDGSKQSVTETIDDKGRVTRTVFTYNEKTFYSKYERYNHKNQLESCSESIKRDDFFFSTYTVYKKGKKKYSSTSYSAYDSFENRVSVTKMNDGTFRSSYSSYAYF